MPKGSQTKWAEHLETHLDHGGERAALYWLTSHVESLSRENATLKNQVRELMEWKKRCFKFKSREPVKNKVRLNERQGG